MNLLYAEVHSVKMAQRQRITQEDKERLIRAFEKQVQDYLALADTSAMNRSTARSIIA